MNNNKSNSSSPPQKMSIKKILNKSNLQVTFSKRRAGLFKKASELCTLCGVDITVIVFSPAGKAYSFGHLDVRSIVNKFMTTADHQAAETNDHQSANARHLNAIWTQVLNQLEVERKQRELLDQMMKAHEADYCSLFDDIGLAQLRNALKELKLNIVSRKILLEVAANYNYNNYCGNEVF